MEGVVLLLDRYAPAGLSSASLFDFLKVVIPAIVCLAPVMDC